MGQQHDETSDGQVTKGTITIKDIRSVLDLLVSHLYGGDPHLTIRELLQNAHDALEMRRSNSALHSQDHNYFIRVTLNDFASPNYIEIEDTGIGMSREDITNYLAAVGDTEKLRKAAENPAIIGRFGIGFLSSFIIADHVEVQTCQVGSKEALEWVTYDKVNYDLRSVSLDGFTGTRVRLYLKNQYESGQSQRIVNLRTTSSLERVIQEYGYLLSYPIFVGRSHETGRRVNCIQSPWESDVEAEQAFRVLFGRDKPVYTFRFRSGPDPATGFTAQGVFYFRHELSPNPSIRLYVKRVLVDAKETRLLPLYAPFIQGMVECPNLDIDLARLHTPAFSAAYKWLRAEVYRQYTRAFVEFASLRMDDFIAMWTKVNNTFVNCLLNSVFPNEEDEESELTKLAEEFTIQSARYFPFYQVDVNTGPHGYPHWKTIDEMVQARRSTMSGEKITVYFTESRDLAERELLLAQYGELLDVSHQDKSFDQLMSMILRLNLSFHDFEVQKVSANRFDPLTESENHAWQDVIGVIKANIVFPARGHEVVVEKFHPESSPLLITENTVDDAAMKRLEEGIGRMAAPDTAEVVPHLIKQVKAMSGKGGLITFHINARNDIFQRLQKAIAVVATRDAAILGILNISFRAVLDHFGSNINTDMLSRDRNLTNRIIEQLLGTMSDNAELLKKTDELQRQVENQQVLLSKVMINGQSRDIEAIVGFVDLADSTSSIFGNAKGRPEHVAKLVRFLIGIVQTEIESFGRTISFTGDGLHFFIEQPQSPTPAVGVKLKSLATNVAQACRSNPEIEELLRELAIDPPALRIALSFGRVRIGPIGPGEGLIGLPAVEAARLCENKELYKDIKTDLLITQAAIDKGAEWLIWRATEFTSADSFIPRGLSQSLRVYRAANP